MEYFMQALKQYADFNGNTKRKDYWMFVLFYILFAGVASILDNFLGLRGSYGTGAIGGIYSLALIIPSLAAGVRRLHDTGKSGWWMLISLIPIIGWIWLIVLLVADSK